MSNEICPRCRVLRDMLVSKHEEEIKDEEGKAFKVITKNYHCSMCNTFVRSEESKIQLKKETEI